MTVIFAPDFKLQLEVDTLEGPQGTGKGRMQNEQEFSQLRSDFLFFLVGLGRQTALCNCAHSKS